jgi:hypothetical protein
MKNNKIQLFGEERERERETEREREGEIILFFSLKSFYVFRSKVCCCCCCSFHLFLELLLLWQKNALIGRLGSTLIFKDPLIILQFIALPNHLTYMSVSTTEVE